MASEWGKAGSFWWKGRLPVFAAGLAGVAWMDAHTPYGSADWLILIGLVSVAAALGSVPEMLVVGGAATACAIAGLWTSPPEGIPFWLEAANRLGAVAVIWVLVLLARSRRIAERELRVLRGLVPICASCKRIRYGVDQWQSVEQYVTDHSEAQFTHTLCPACYEHYRAQI